MRVKEPHWPERWPYPQSAPTRLGAVTEPGTELEVGGGRPIGTPSTASHPTESA
jgi:hypothetical protein